ncbi:uncharacterized protein LOC107606737 [Arachis ipaensis]|uniref:uncharacterized protein LOC107606737 n=1 Tax=Arachis ipaensis TaxID=130454 RepID=UPI0007AF8C8C|nr:uncharacterized protein LOC107606737 [Arachis ipaensis]
MVWIKWDTRTRPKKDGGLGIKDLRAQNLALLGKQCWRLMKYPNSTISRMLKAKYFRYTDFLHAEIGSVPSWGWRSVLEGRKVIEKGLLWKIGSGTNVRIFYDPWLPPPVPLNVPQNALTIPPNMQVRVQSSARAFAPLRPINVARSLVLPLRGSSLSDPLSASWSFSNLLHSRDCSFSPVSCLFSDCRRRNKLSPLPLHSDPPLHCFLTPASLFLFFTSDSDLCPSPSTFPSATYSFKVNLIEWLKAMVGNRKSEELIDQKLPEKPSSKALKLCSVGCS